MTATPHSAPLGPLVDTHAHIYLPDHPVITGATHRPERACTTQDYLRTLDEHGVLFGVIAAPSFLGSYNDYTLEALRAHRRLRATVIVEPGVDIHILRAMDADGVIGIRFSLRDYAGMPDLDSPEYRRLLRRVADLGWHVHLYAEGDRVAALVPRLIDAGVNLVIDHFGNPDPNLGESSPGFQAALRALQTGRGWVKISGSYRSPGCDHRALAAKLLAEAGPERLLFGSDWPFVGYEDRFTYRDTVTWFESFVPDPATRACIGRTAALLYRFA
ncbi:MAG TPA: amidohydrolase family protein [Acetobacteraceae bacterium]